MGTPKGTPRSKVQLKVHLEIHLAKVHLRKTPTGTPRSTTTGTPRGAPRSTLKSKSLKGIPEDTPREYTSHHLRVHRRRTYILGAPLRVRSNTLRLHLRVSSYPRSKQGFQGFEVFKILRFQEVKI